MTKLVGRNAPCPCGSGLKHKRCCLGKEAAGRGAFTADERDRALAALMRFADRPEFEAHHQRALTAFWRDLEGHGDDEVREVMALEQSQVAYFTWFAFDFVLGDDGRTAADLFLEREGARLRPGEREYLARMRPSHLRLYEVLEVKPDEGLGLLDLWTEERVWVRERLGTRQLVRWDFLAARLMRGAADGWVLDGAPYLYPAAEKEEILKDVRHIHRTFTRRFPGIDDALFFKAIGMLFHRLWLVHVALRPLPTLLTAEGDPLVFAKAVFDVRDRAALTAALAGHPDLDRQDDGSYAWHEPEDAQGFRRGLGTFVLEGDRVTFQTTSESRAERGRRFLESLAGNAVRFRATSYEDAWRAIRKRPIPEDPEPAEAVPPEVEAQLVGEYYERHYRSWPDTPLPALGGRTPRHAARLKTVRPTLIALLKDMESRSERERREGRPAYDFGWMWSELDLTRPE